MNLDEWSKTPEEKQRLLVEQWSKPGETDAQLKYITIAWEAAALLKRSLSSVSTVTNVEVAGGEILNEEFPITRKLALYVYTLLPESTLLKEIPDRYASFCVTQLNLGDKKTEFTQTLKVVMKRLRGWEESVTLKWVEKFDDALSGRQLSAIYHYGPIQAIVPSLVPEGMRVEATKRGALHGALRDAIELPPDFDGARIVHPDQVEGYDWEQARKRVDDLIAASLEM